MKTYEYYLAKHGNQAPPVDISALVKNFGVEVVCLPFKRLDGFCAQINESGFEIGINSALSKHRQRFTLAHEFKHFLHQEASLSQDGVVLREDATFHMENDANDFAGKLLVSGTHLAKYRQFFGVKELSDIFQVSETVIRIRLVQIDKERKRNSSL